MASMGYMTVCSCIRFWSARWVSGLEAGGYNSYAGECACRHVLQQGEVGREGFVATHRDTCQRGFED